MGAPEPIKKPATVQIAVKLLYLTIVASFLSATSWYLTLMLGFGAEPLPAVTELVYSLVSAAAGIFLTLKTSEGKNWARLIFAFLVVVAILGELCPSGAVVATNPSLEGLRRALDMVGFVLFAVQTLAVVLLFLGDSNQYFRSMKQADTQVEMQGSAEQYTGMATRGVVNTFAETARQHKATTIGGVLGAMIGVAVYMLFVYIALRDVQEFGVGTMLFFGLIGLVAGGVYGALFSLIFARRFSTTISVVAGLAVTILLVPLSSFCCLMFALA